MKVKDALKKIRSKDINELSKELNDNFLKLIELKRNLMQEKLKKTSEIKKIKKNIARIKTIMREKLAKELEREDE